MNSSEKHEYTDRAEELNVLVENLIVGDTKVSIIQNGDKFILTKSSTEQPLTKTELTKSEFVGFLVESHRLITNKTLDIMNDYKKIFLRKLKK